MPKLHEKGLLGAAIFWGNALEQFVARCPVSRLGSRFASLLSLRKNGNYLKSTGRPESVITWKISTREPGITIVGSQLTRVAKSCHLISKLSRDLFKKASQPGSCNHALSSIARDLSTHPISPRTHMPKTLAPINTSIPPSLYEWIFPYLRSLHKRIRQKEHQKHLKQKASRPKWSL